MRAQNDGLKGMDTLTEDSATLIHEDVLDLCAPQIPSQSDGFHEPVSPVSG